MTSLTGNTRRALLAGLAVAGMFAVMAGPASAAPLVSQATAQAVKANVAGLLNVAISNPATAATNDGNGSNAEIDSSPLISALGAETFLTAGALAEAAEANQDGSSYGCAGVVSPGGGIAVGGQGATCTPTGNGTGGITLDLGQLPGIGAAFLATGDVKVTIDSITAHGQQTGTNPAVLGALVANITVTVGNSAPIVVNIAATPNQDLLGAVLAAITGSQGATVGAAISLALTPLVSLTANYQPAPEPNAAGVSSVTGLHITLLGGALAVVDLAKVTVGPNVAVAPVDAFSFQNLPLILGGLALMVAIGFGLRTGTRRLRGLASA